ncbi:MAG TPA: BadF/BadG/BcrA/BcrD ATPase family protein [Roseiarcus sp.]|nr:BadF/BadG/BcrA/BcrD ATPase family protein [Roseiarcus sp.]
MAGRLYFCVDAGATRCRGRLYDEAATVLANAEGGPANFSYDRPQAMLSITKVWEQLSAAIGHDPDDMAGITLAVGGAGLYVRKQRDAFVEHCRRFGEMAIMSDGYAALIGAGDGKPSALVSVGTGVAGHRLFADGSSIQRDAWGWIVGDRGGGCWLGTRALRHMVETLDGIAPPSALSAAMMESVGGVPGLLEGALSNLNAQRLAAFAPLVLAQAAANCPVASGILSGAVDYLVRLVDVLEVQDAPLYLTGGLAAAMKPMLGKRTGRRIEDASGDALYGCLLVAQGKAPGERTVFG